MISISIHFHFLRSRAWLMNGMRSVPYHPYSWEERPLPMSINLPTSITLHLIFHGMWCRSYLLPKAYCIKINLVFTRRKQVILCGLFFFVYKWTLVECSTHHHHHHWGKRGVSGWALSACAERKKPSGEREGYGSLGPNPCHIATHSPARDTIDSTTLLFLVFMWAFVSWILICGVQREGEKWKRKQENHHPQGSSREGEVWQATRRHHTASDRRRKSSWVGCASLSLLPFVFL